MRRLGIGSLIGLAMLAGAGGAAHAAPKLRVQVDQKGDFILLGNTLGHECDPANGAVPDVGTVGNCGMANTLIDTAPDVFWRSDAPMDGQAQADTTIAPAQARSTAVLNLPAGATVTHAYLYWAARTGAAQADTAVTLDRPGANGFSSDINAIDQIVAGNERYQSVADITSIVQMNGSGAYRVSGVNVADIRNQNNQNNFAGWWIAVFYQLDTEPPRNLALFDGFDAVSNGNPQNTTLSGFLVPMAGYDAKIGAVAFEGDTSLMGDQFLFNNTALSDDVNPATNFFNSSRSRLGMPESNVGDLPKLKGTAGSMSGMDLDVLDITSLVSAGQTSVPIAATSSGDTYHLAGFITSISTFKPDFTSSTKEAADENGGALLAGDVVQYTINVANNGNDTSIDTVLTDPLPAGVTYVPGSLSITMGANAGAKTDAVGDDQGEYDTGSNTVTVRLGSGANGTKGGEMAVGETAVVTFQVTINPDASGLIKNQASVTAGGKQGAPVTDTPTDGNGPAGGNPPTDIIVDQCGNNADCAAPTPYCHTEIDPNTCVECFLDAQCPATEPTCDPVAYTCSCIASDTEVCDGKDNDCDGTVDEDCVDSDGDGVVDEVEVVIGTNPMDADSDDDGVSDGKEPSYALDSDNDGLINAKDPDSDNDGLFDGTELGNDCSGPGTNAEEGHCIPDGDAGQTKTDPLDADTDNGGVTDGAEDTNLNGVVDQGETDPNNEADDTTPVDKDGDGLSDSLEVTLGSNPNDADSDDDGVPDGQEVNLADDTDGDGLINVIDVDSDNDGLFDGTEMGLDCSNPATDPKKGHCKADADMGATTTSPVDADSDDGGVPDGQEDLNQNGVIDEGETDPNNKPDDTKLEDSDGDGIIDAIEVLIGTNPMDGDSDDDGVPDGQEPNYNDDHDGDGKINALDPDSDGDGLFDGTELGQDCSNPATNKETNNCVPDADGGATKTNPLDPDTDNGGVSDGEEDTNKNGAVDTGERDPNNTADDMNAPPCVTDSNCGDVKSGKICDTLSGTCADGCRGLEGNGCPDGQRCSSLNATVGVCQPGGPADPDDIVAEGNGLLCSAHPAGNAGNSKDPLLVTLGALAMLAWRRRRRAA